MKRDLDSIVFQYDTGIAYINLDPYVNDGPRKHQLGKKPGILRSEEFDGRTVVDFNKDGKLVGIELLGLTPPYSPEKVVAELKVRLAGEGATRSPVFKRLGAVIGNIEGRLA